MHKLINAQARLIQDYMLLHSQQTHVRRRLSVDSTSLDLIASAGPSKSYTSPYSPSNSPPCSRRTSHSRSSSIGRRSSGSSLSSTPPGSPRRTSIEPIPEESVSGPSSDELKLADLSCRIKATLTDLYNCETVKHDGRMRSWVATRLMDAEHDIKEQRRRTHSLDAQQAGHIAASLRV